MVEIGEKRQIFDLNEIRPGEKSGVITVSNNGIFNPRDDALKNAVKQNGSHARSDGIYVVYNRPATRSPSCCMPPTIKPTICLAEDYP